MKTKEKIITGMAALATTAALSGLFFIEKNAAKELVSFAEEPQAEETQEQTASGFRMIEGASVRLNVEKGSYGIRFGAKVEDENKAYSMMIVPTQLTAGYENNKIEGETLSQYCERIATKHGGSVAKADNLTANANGEIACALVEIKWENLNRDFIGLAYYEEPGKRIEATLASDGIRSVNEVATKALESDDLTEAEREAATKLQSDGEKQARGIAIDAAMGEALFGLTLEENADGEWLDHGTRRVTLGTEEKHAEGWKIHGNEIIDTDVNGEVWNTRLNYEDGTASFVTWSKQAAKAEFYTSDNVSARVINFSANEARMIALPTEELMTYSRLKFTTTEPDELGNSEYFIGEITEKTAEDAANEVSDLITALPSEEELKNASDSDFDTYRISVMAALNLYNGLSERGKSLTTGREKLSALIQAASETQTMLFDWNKNDKKYSKLIEKGDHSNWGELVKIDKTPDPDYGNCWKVIRDNSKLDYYYTEIFINSSSVTEETVGYTEIVFYVYTDVSANIGETLDAMITEAKYSKNNYSAEKMKKPIELINGSWVKVSLTREEFILCTRLTALFDVGEEGFLKISPFYGVK